MREKPKRRRSSTAGRYIAPPVQRAVRLIRHVAEGNPVLNMSETAKTLKINRTTLLRLLHTLELEGFVERRPNGAGPRRPICAAWKLSAKTSRRDWRGTIRRLAKAELASKSCAARLPKSIAWPQAWTRKRRAKRIRLRKRRRV